MDGFDVIPVVRGGTDYDRFFPEDTFVNANHFATPKDLALYLKELMEDKPRYEVYSDNKKHSENADTSTSVTFDLGLTSRSRNICD